MAKVTIKPALTGPSYSKLFTTASGDVTIGNISTTNLSGSVNGFTLSYDGDFRFFNGRLLGGDIYALTLIENGIEIAKVENLFLDLLDVASYSTYQLKSAMMAGADVFLSTTNAGDTYETFGGNDLLELGSGNDRVYGGTGIDTLVIDDVFANADLSSSFASLRLESAMGIDTLTDVEILDFNNGRYAVQCDGNGRSTQNDDTLNGDSILGVTRDVIFGEDGDDHISGRTDNDRLFGGLGRDSLFGGTGVDLLDGGAGADMLDGQKGSDELLGRSGNDVLKGGTGNDRLVGHARSDTLDGGAGHDILIGGTGRDVLIGRKGDDRLTGGAQRDEFHFRRGDGSDTITDFAVGEDKIKIFSGANKLADIAFARSGQDVRLSFANVDVLVEDVTVSQMQDTDNFAFV